MPAELRKSITLPWIFSSPGCAREANSCAKGIETTGKAGSNAWRVVLYGQPAKTHQRQHFRAPVALLDMDHRGLQAVARASVHAYNTEAEIAALADALRRLLRT